MSRLIFSKDRPAQLDLLLRSLERHLPDEGQDTTVIWYASDRKFAVAYEQIVSDPPQEKDGFDSVLRETLAACDETVTFFCDDDVLFRSPDRDPVQMLADGQVLSVSLYLGRNLDQPIPRDFPVWQWRWRRRNDFGYPVHLDGDTFRTADVHMMIGTETIPNPNLLETIMLRRISLFKDMRPLAASACDEQCLVSNPVNKVAIAGSDSFGKRYPADTAKLNRRFLAGKRLSLDRMSFSGIRSLHHEINLVWA